jgi:RES domain
MVCENCFGDEFLKKRIIELSTTRVARCEYCLSEEAAAIAPDAASDLVSQILSLYKEDTGDQAKPLGFYLRRDWHLFDGVSEENSVRLIDFIFQGQQLSTKRFRTEEQVNANVPLWDEFKSELKYENRFFPKKHPELKNLENLFSFLIEEKNTGVSFFRARICGNNTRFPIAQMGRPPKDLVKGGRANPFGISYLYTASDSTTAISEVRPHVGDFVSVARYELNRRAVLLDLRNPRKTVSPFEISEADLLRMLNELSYLCKLGEQLSKPVLPREADLEYLPSQYLCEFIKHLKYDGVIYNSSVAPGFNVAFFTDDSLTPTEPVELCSITSVEYSTVRN